MEKFKACEKEMKTKAFSKEGLIAAQKLDPKERERAAVQDWLSGVVAELGRQVEQTEAEIAGIQATTKRKKGGAAGGRAEELTSLNARRLWHVGRLEIILRLVDNNTLPLEKVLSVKEDVNYFVESNVVCIPFARCRGFGARHRCLMMPFRRRTSTRMKASMMNSTLTKRRKPSGQSSTKQPIPTMSNHWCQVRVVRVVPRGSPLTRATFFQTYRRSL
jgi:hypothetical protein